MLVNKLGANIIFVFKNNIRTYVTNIFLFRGRLRRSVVLFHVQTLKLRKPFQNSYLNPSAKNFLFAK